MGAVREFLTIGFALDHQVKPFRMQLLHLYSWSGLNNPLFKA